ncbi:Hypothetical protein Minf_2064 [Methylacidiphilum infernorum V4]|uniref:Uncharacterized protein n=1 Tax=Methylacidiphilum infernorum (isolate V4) TaxID=481448 RepID=B3DZ26_METI4|nr:Hypothetical protein Minf_2064 [Methylacidiphilum infernorum V4]
MAALYLESQKRPLTWNFRPRGKRKKRGFSIRS